MYVFLRVLFHQVSPPTMDPAPVAPAPTKTSASKWSLVANSFRRAGRRFLAAVNPSIGDVLTENVNQKHRANAGDLAGETLSQPGATYEAPTVSAVSAEDPDHVVLDRSTSLTRGYHRSTSLGRAASARGAEGEATGADDSPRRSIEAAPSFNSHQGRANLLVNALPEVE